MNARLACLALFLFLLSSVLACSKSSTPVSKDAPVENPPPLAEMKVLEQRIGTWDTRMSAKPAVWTPDGLELTGVEKIELILKGRYIEGKAVNSDGSEAAWMATYDANQKKYRSWFFNSHGAASTSIGQYDDQSGTMTWTDTNADGVTMTARWRFIDADTLEWDAVARDAAGKVHFDAVGKLSRKK